VLRPPRFQKTAQKSIAAEFSRPSSVTAKGAKILKENAVIAEVNFGPMNFTGYRTSQELEPIALDLGDILDEIFMDVGIDMTRTMSELP